jgi:lysozyme family protein
MVIDPQKMGIVNGILTRIQSRKSLYYDFIESAIHVPWRVTAVIHYRESGLSLSRHLHNGDPLSARTVHVPAGRPINGEPPFSWQTSAMDALRLKGLDKVTDWSLPNTLSIIEGYNGFGYRDYHHMPSPYLWAWSSNYHKGKYVADGKFDPQAVDQQCGAAVLLKLLS